MDGTNLTFEKLGETAVNTYNLYSYGNGEFLSFAQDDVTRNTVHIHFYKKESTFEHDEVNISCHAIWSKSASDGWQRQQLTLAAKRSKDYWTATLTKGDIEVKGESKAQKFAPPPNSDLKDRLYEEVVNYLADILAHTLNS